MLKNILFLLTIVFISCSSAEEKEIVLYKNLNGYTIQSDSLVSFSAMMVENGKVIYIGEEKPLYAVQPTKMVDLDGKTVLPGLIDAHAHIFGLGYLRINVNLAGIETKDSTLKKIAAFAKENPESQWIFGRGWNQTLWEENAFPTAEDLNKLNIDKPIFLDRIDGHAAWANSKALKLAGISRETIDPDGGKIIRNKSGDPTGVLVDNAINLIEKYMPEKTKAENEKALRLALEEIARLGMTSVHDAGITLSSYNMYKEFADKNELSTRVYAMIGGAGVDFDLISEKGLLKNYAQDRLFVQSVKLYQDGALGSRGAAMIHPYSDDPVNSGLLFYDQVELEKMMFKVASKGYQVNTHAIGDRANRTVLKAIKKTVDELKLLDHRFRIEHAQIVHPKDIPLFKEYGVIASMQPTHATSDMNMAEDRVGSDRILGAYAWRSFLNQGTVLAGGSDFPVEDANPFFGLYSAVTRKDHQGKPVEGWYPEQKLSREEALKSFTIDAAWAGFMQDVTGSLEVGKWADFIVIDRNYFEIPDSEIWQIQVLETWLGGEQVYKK
jgi:predicted amidohydrolase YtcJ